MKIKELKSALKKDDITDFIDPDVYGYAYVVYGGPWTVPFPPSQRSLDCSKPILMIILRSMVIVQLINLIVCYYVGVDVICNEFKIFGCSALLRLWI